MIARVGIVGALLLASTASAAPLGWDAAFAARSAPPTVRLVATYRDGGGREHRLQLWRDGDRRLVRRTDERIELHVERAGGDYRYVVVDRERKLAYDATRTNLARIGIFADWSALATLIARPDGAYKLRAAGSARTSFGACRRFELARGATRERICWSDSWKLPLVIERRIDGAWKPQLTVVELARDGVADSVFAVPAGLQTIDANRDIAED